MINRFLKHIVSIKYELIISILYIPYMITNISKSRADALILAFIIHLLLLTMVYYSTSVIRQDLKQYVYQLKPIKIIDIKPIKKEIFTKAFNLIPTTAQINKTFLNIYK